MLMLLDVIDDQARAVIDKAYAHVEELLVAKRECVNKVAALLLEKEVISHMDMVEILGPRPFASPMSFEELSNDPQNV